MWIRTFYPFKKLLVVYTTKCLCCFLGSGFLFSLYLVERTKTRSVEEKNIGPPTKKLVSDNSSQQQQQQQQQQWRIFPTIFRSSPIWPCFYLATNLFFNVSVLTLLRTTTAVSVPWCGGFFSLGWECGRSRCIDIYIYCIYIYKLYFFNTHIYISLYG